MQFLGYINSFSRYQSYIIGNIRHLDLRLQQSLLKKSVYSSNNLITNGGYRKLAIFNKSDILTYRELRYHCSYQDRIVKVSEIFKNKAPKLRK